jgi:acyl-CoA synthetase (AMP-forming)/AMP-acid ligase II/acyl carrier protein
LIGRLLREAAQRSPDAIALAAPGREAVTYERLTRQVDSVVWQLKRAGVDEGDRVAIVLPNGPEMAVAFLAATASAVAAPLNPAYRRAEFEFYLGDLRPKALVIGPGQDSPSRDVASAMGIPVLELSLTPEPNTRFPSDGRVAQADAPALLLHTSGTTSRPKLVMLTHANLCESARHIQAVLALQPRDRCLNVMPLFHVHGLVAALLASVAAGASVVCTPGFNASRFFSWLDEFRPSWYTAVPTMHQAILAQAAAHSEVIVRCPLRFIRSCSAALAPRVMAELEAAFGAPVIEAYGMTEASHQMTSNRLPPGLRKPGSVGMAAGPQVAILDDAGNSLDRGQAGEVAVRGASVIQAYQNHPAANQASFTNGWFRTGDLGCLDEDGFLFLTGRLKEIINRGGEKISPREVDDVLVEHPAVAQAVTFAVPHPTLGQEIACAVVLRAQASLAAHELRGFARTRLAEFKVPRRVLFLDELPKGPTGKPQRIGLAERLGVAWVERDPAVAAAAFVAPRTEIEREVAAIWRDVLRVDRVGVYDDFSALGGDSLLAAQVISRIGETMPVNTGSVDLLGAPTVAAIAEMIAAGKATVGP